MVVVAAGVSVAVLVVEIVEVAVAAAGVVVVLIVGVAAVTVVLIVEMTVDTGRVEVVVAPAFVTVIVEIGSVFVIVTIFTSKEVLYLCLNLEFVNKCNLENTLRIGAVYHQSQDGEKSQRKLHGCTSLLSRRLNMKLT